MTTENTDTPLNADCPSATCSAFHWARYNDATVNQMLVGGSQLTNIIGVLAHEKAELIKRITELELIAPKKITLPDGSVIVYRCPNHLLPNEHGPQTANQKSQ